MRSSFEMLLCAVLLWVAGIAWLVAEFSHAPVGYEDAGGFHYGREGDQ